MVELITNDQLREAAAAKILAQRDRLLFEQRSVKEEQAALAVREREIDRELAECRAAAKFFDVQFDPSINAEMVRDLEARVFALRRRSIVFRQQGQFREADMSEQRASAALSELNALRGQLPQQLPQQTLPIPPAPLPPPPAPTPSPLGVGVSAASPQPAVKRPKVRDMVLDQLRSAGDEGQKAVPITRYIETTYSMQLHAKTVGMTLYRLQQDGLVHRKGQTWFHGPQVGQVPPVSAEDPGAQTPGITHEVT